MNATADIRVRIDEQALVDSLLRAVQIPSVTPNEMAFAEWLHGRLQEGGWDDVQLREAAPGRPNVYAFCGDNDGDAAGHSLILAGHMDTVHADDWRAQWKGSERADPFAAHIIDGEIWGRGAADQKAGICMIMEAMRALHRAGYRPAGGVTGLFVCDEESGQPGSGVSLGMRAAVQQLYSDAASRKPDFAVYTEPTTCAIYTAQMGFLIADIAVTGKSAYFGTPELGIDALRAGHALLTKLWTHDAALRDGDSHALLGERFLLVTQVQSGGNIAVPGEFRLSLIQKFLPGDSLDAAAAALHDIGAQIEAEHKVQVEVAFSAARDHLVGGTPDEIAADAPGAVALADSIRAVSGQPARILGAPFWSEKPLLHAAGIPGVYFAPGDIAHCHTAFERLSVRELIAATNTLVDFIIRWCGAEKINA